MKTIRILQVLDKISLSSGVSSVVLSYYKNMNHKKIQFDFMVNEEVPEEMRKDIEKQGGKIYVFPNLKIKNYFKYKGQLIDFFKKHKEYKIIHGHTPNVAALYMKIAKDFDISVRIIHSHNALGAETLYKRMRNRILYTLAIREATDYFACGVKAAQYLYGKRLEKKECYIMSNAIDISKYKFDSEKRNIVRKKLGISDDTMVLGHVGRMCIQKNQEFLVDVLKKMYDNRESAVLLLIGDGEDQKKIQHKVKECGLEKQVIFLGVTTSVNDYMQAMDVFVLPSRFEGLPIVSIEAQAAGLPCVVADTITKEVQLSENMQFLSLDSPLEVWEKAILKAVRYERKTVKMETYDIRIEAAKLEHKYMELVNNNLAAK